MTKKKKNRGKNRPHPNPGSLLRMLRLNRGMTLQELAKEIGIGTNTLCTFERGEFGHLGSAQTLARYFGVTLNELVTDDYASLGAHTVIPAPTFNRNRTRIRKSQEQCNDTGDRGEEYVVALERKRLAGTVFSNLVSGNPSDDLSIGFDVFSFEDGSPMYIEVKSTLSNDPKEAFSMSAGEYEFAKTCAQTGRNFKLYRVSGMRKKQDRWHVDTYSAEDIIGMKAEVESYRMSWR